MYLIHHFTTIKSQSTSDRPLTGLIVTTEVRYCPVLSTHILIAFSFNCYSTLTLVLHHTDDPDSYFPEPITQLRGMSNLGSRTSSGSFSGPSDLTAFQSANNIWPSAASGGSSGAADKEGEGDITLGPVDKEKKVDKRRRGISTGFRCSIFPLRIPSPSISNPNVSSIPTFSKPGTPLIEECFSEAELWLTPTLESMGYEEIDGMIDWPESVPGKG